MGHENLIYRYFNWRDPVCKSGAPNDCMCSVKYLFGEANIAADTDKPALVNTLSFFHCH